MGRKDCTSSQRLLSKNQERIVMKDLIQRITSRKFLLAVAAVITCIANGNIPGVVAVVLGYFGVNVAETKVSGDK